MSDNEKSTVPQSDGSSEATRRKKRSPIIKRIKIAAGMKAIGEVRETSAYALRSAEAILLPPEATPSYRAD
jgi:hypothetical protein